MPPPRRNEVVDRDLGWRGMLRRVDALRGSAYTKVGILADSERGGLHQQGPDGKASKLPVAEIGAIAEFGNEDGTQPPCSFVRSTFDEMREELVADSRHLIVAVVLDGTMTATHALNILGLKLATGIRAKITQGTGVPPPNAPSVQLRKAKKGRTARFFKRAARTLGDAMAQVGALAGVRTLVDTGRMVGAVSWAVVANDDAGNERQEQEHYVGGPGR